MILLLLAAAEPCFEASLLLTDVHTVKVNTPACI